MKSVCLEPYTVHDISDAHEYRGWGTVAIRLPWDKNWQAGNLPHPSTGVLQPRPCRLLSGFSDVTFPG